MLSSKATPFTPWVIGNWKMNPATPLEQQQLTQQLIDQVAQAQITNVNLAIAPTYLHMLMVQQQLQQAHSDIQLVAQDISRFADTHGYTVDRYRDASPYRDWVIRSFNADKPFDEFTIEQLAGDLLPNPSQDQLTATAFHRNTMNNDEGGTDDEEFRVAAVLDRVSTTFEVWQSTTMACVQCHSHPYDPIKHAEYYKFLAYFNNTRETLI